MTALGKLFRTTAFKLSLAFLVLSAIGAGLVLSVVAWQVQELVDQETASTIDAEAAGLSEQYAQGGIRQLGIIIDGRSREPGSSVYLLTNFAGQPLAGNVARLPQGVLDRPGFVETPYETVDQPTADRRALAKIFLLPGGFRLLVGHDLRDRARIGAVMVRALATSLIFLTALGGLGGLFVARRVLHRIDAMSTSARAIMAGDMSQRLAVIGSGDELDRLALNLNEMLGRIDELMAGLREVSDNIAHDLRTPLTRLRNHAEAALRREGDKSDYRAALERTIEESDGLIKVFNALLMIARAEAGTERAGMSEFDIGQAARGIAELYEPFAEEAGVALRIDVEPGLTVVGNRELIGQTIANLLDNALKYGAPALPHALPSLPGPASEVGEGPSRPDAAPASPTDVTLSVHRVGAEVELAVADHGPGIAAADRTRVLGRFVRLEGARSRPGSGLGLSLAAAVARMHGGAVRLEDNAPGLRFILALPVRPRALPEPAMARLEPPR
ncbi:HAMP domain-containing sensor histidine kinase [Methylocapsa sp. S129]|uniref:sensor histidine kinase n=1 Tax=Methylocapsa sp. S129 TaxID=1641869 RepID=UPI00131BD184|nr:ATP-binding protein [Methylocapsa sp. S129]